MSATTRLRQTLGAFYLGLGCATLAWTPALAAEPAKIAIVRANNNVLQFSPATRTVKSGDILHWINLTNEEHTITPVSPVPGFKGTSSLALENLESTRDEHFEAINSAVGKINYQCDIHPEMTGTIDVVP